MASTKGLSAMISSLQRRPYVFLTVAIIFTTFLFYHARPTPLPPRLEFHPDTTFHAQPKTFDGTWNTKRDANNLLLTDQQCDAAFPGLFEEVERPVALRRNNHITKAEIDKIVPINGHLRCMIYDMKLYVISTEGQVYSRGIATLHALHRAIITSPETLPNIEFSMNIHDKVSSDTQWAFARQSSDTYLWLIPDFGFWSWPETKIGSYAEVQMKAMEMDNTTSWDQKINKIMWRGATMQLKVREQFVAATKDQEWADVVALDWHNKESMTNDLRSMDQHCEYKYLAHTEGNSYSGRLKYLQNCRSVVVAHKLEWIQHHHPLMKSSGPEQNYVEVDSEFKDLEKVIKELRKNDKETEKIAARTVEVFRDRYLTPAAEVCYWRRLIKGWAEVSFEPEFFEMKDGKKKWRGLPVESYVLERRLDWEPY